MEPFETAKAKAMHIPPELLLKILEKASIENLLEWRQTCPLVKELADQVMTKRALMWTPTFPSSRDDLLINQILQNTNRAAATEQSGTILKNERDLEDFLANTSTSLLSGKVFPNGTLKFIPDNGYFPVNFLSSFDEWKKLLGYFKKIVEDYGEEVISFETELNPCNGHFLDLVEPIFQLRNLRKLSIIAMSTRSHRHSFEKFKKSMADYPHLENLEEVRYILGDALYFHRNLFSSAKYRQQITKMVIKNHIYSVYSPDEDPDSSSEEEGGIENVYVDLPPSELIPAVTKLKIYYPTKPDIEWLKMSSASLKEISFKCVNILKHYDRFEPSFKEVMKALDIHHKNLELICLDFKWDPCIKERTRSQGFLFFQQDQNVLYENTKYFLISYQFLVRSFWFPEFQGLINKFPNLEALQILNCKGNGVFVSRGEEEDQAESERLAKEEGARLRLWETLPRTASLIFFPEFNAKFLRGKQQMEQGVPPMPSTSSD